MLDRPLLFAFILFLGILGLSIVAAPVLLRTPQPLVVVMSDSMEPTLRPGDLLILEGYSSKEPKAGDVVVFFSRRHGRVLVHRVVGLDESGVDFVLFTKGDAVTFVDEEPVRFSELWGFVRWKLRWLGLPSYFLWRALGWLKASLPSSD